MQRREAQKDMAGNYKFYFDKSGSPCARGPAAEKQLMTFLEQDVQGSDHICRVLMDDLTAIEDESGESREFIGNAHSITFAPTGITIAANLPSEEPESGAGSKETSEGESTTAEPSPPQTDQPTPLETPVFEVGLKRFREVLEDWEAFILDDQIDDSMSEDDYS